MVRIEGQEVAVARDGAGRLGLVEGRRTGLQIVAARQHEERVGMVRRGRKVPDQPVVLARGEHVILGVEVGLAEIEEGVVRLLGARELLDVGFEIGDRVDPVLSVELPLPRS
jgi:hypothetical protein